MRPPVLSPVVLLSACRFTARVCHALSSRHLHSGGYITAHEKFLAGRGSFVCQLLIKKSSTSANQNSFNRRMVQVASAYGSWKSPITSQLATEKSVSFQDLQIDRNQTPGVVYWSECRFDEGGRYVICSKAINESEVKEWTPAGFNARTRVHEYGGGAFIVNDGKVYFSNFDDQGLYTQTAPGEAPKPLTPQGLQLRFADAQYSKKHKRLMCIQEDHMAVKAGTVREPTNSVVSVCADTGSISMLVSGCDFYSDPHVSPDGKQIVWVQWNHPNMPWDSTEIWLAELNDAGDALVAGSQKKVAGGDELSVMAPRWTPEGTLIYISDATDWWNLYHVTNGEHVNICPQDVDIGWPHWEFAASNLFELDPRKNGQLIYTSKQKLHLFNMKTKSSRVIETGFTNLDSFRFSSDGNVYCAAGSPTKFRTVICINTETGKVDTLRESRTVPVDSGYISVPRSISWPTANSKTSHGFFYPPQNKDCKGLDGTLPPLLVKVHGGPTGHTFNTLSLSIQYFTSRGFAILDVNYRGSTGHGKIYRNALRGNWGICDVEDCSSGAQHLADSGEVDGQKLCIDGGSAGGYTTLACLAFTDVFKAGASHYGVSDISALAAETHKFESRYCDLLVRPYTDEYKHVFEERSPINNIDKFNCPIAFFQGDEDEIVPPNQAERMYSCIKEKGLPTTFVLFEGEQHGFRKAENIQKALDGEFYFYSKVFGFEAADKHCKLDIVNLKD